MSTLTIHPGTIHENLSQQFTRFTADAVVERLWKKDHTIWRTEEVHRKSILNRLGWLDSLDLMQQNIGMLTQFGEEVRAAGFRHVVVLGMGGSSLCPDVCRATFGSAPGFPSLSVLDSTNPTSVLRIENALDLSKTLFIVASKSGGTTETNMFYQYFFDRVSSVSKEPGMHFVAVTDAETKMESIAKEKKFRKIFVNPTDIGGRYSALSYFGLVPMALIGMDIRALLASAEEMRRQSKFDAVQNPAAQLGLLMGEAHNEGMDKMTLIASPEVSTFAYWVEQLVAESTGKEGKGVLPVEGEAWPERYDASVHGEDRFFVFLLLERDAAKADPLRKELAAASVPHAVIMLKDPYDLGSQFFLWEFGTAVCAVALHINPFDEPNVKESKDNTVQVIDEFRKSGALPANRVVCSEGNVRITAEAEYAATLPAGGLAPLLHAHLTGKAGEDYIALLAYIDQSAENERMLYTLRGELTRRYRLPVTVGFGPRYLHSTGQLHKGGPSSGIFLIITAREPHDVRIPGEPFSFGVLTQAQALGDYRSFAHRKLRLLHADIDGSAADGIAALTNASLR